VTIYHVISYRTVVEAAMWTS